MFTISKQTIKAQVHLTGGSISVKPVELDERFLKAQTAILSSVALTAQLHLGKYMVVDYDTALTNYFEQHGWAVV